MTLRVNEEALHRLAHAQRGAPTIHTAEDYLHTAEHFARDLEERGRFARARLARATSWRVAGAFWLWN